MWCNPSLIEKFIVSWDMCSSTSVLERILVKSLVKSRSGDSWLRWCRVFGDASLWILSKRMTNQEVICELLGYNNTTTTSKIDRKTNDGSVNIELSHGTIPSVNCSWKKFSDRNERLETYSDRNINVSLNMIIDRSVNRKGRGVSFSRKSEIV